MDVAIKVLRPDLDPSSQGIQRLRDEGRLLGRLTHPSILRVYDLVIIEGRAALISEYVEGDDLSRVIKTDHRPSSRAVFEIIAQVAAALDAAWSWPSVTDGQPLHLVHRDIKPENIRLDPHGLVKLLDFGIAQAATVKREAETNVNIIMGSSQYLAPERMVQQEVGPESDVFALGCTLYEALTGEALFHRKSMRQMYLLMVDQDRLDPYVTERIDALPDGLLSERARSLLLSMVAYHKADRPSAADVAARCDAVGDGLPGETLRRWARQHDWPPAPEDQGPLEGRTFTTAQPLPAPHAETLDLRAPAAAAHRGPPELTDITTDHGGRQPVLGELDASEGSADLSSPWSGAEGLALSAPPPSTPVADDDGLDPDTEINALPSALDVQATLDRLVLEAPVDDDDEDESDAPTVQVDADELSKRLREMGLVDDFVDPGDEEVPTLTMTVPSKQQQASQNDAARRRALASLEHTSPGIDLPPDGLPGQVVAAAGPREPELPDLGHDEQTDEESESALARALEAADEVRDALAPVAQRDDLSGLFDDDDDVDTDVADLQEVMAAHRGTTREGDDLDLDLDEPEEGPAASAPGPDASDDDYEPQPGDVDLSDVHGGGGSGDVRLRVAPPGSTLHGRKPRPLPPTNPNPTRASVMLFSGLAGILVGAAVFSVPALLYWWLAG